MPGMQVLVYPSPGRRAQRERHNSLPNALGNIATLFIASVLAEYNMGIQDDHIRLTAIPFPLMTHALMTHQIDAAWMVEPFVTTSAMSGATPLVDTDQGATENFPLGAIW
jgi:NitT/TauT family transport system substrate-binding protein